MTFETIHLTAPQEIHITEDKQFFFEVFLRVPKGGRFWSTCGVPFNPQSVFASVSSMSPKVDGPACFVRSVEWYDLSFYLTWELIDRRRWLETGELVAWEHPVDICYAFHGRLKQ